MFQKDLVSKALLAASILSLSSISLSAPASKSIEVKIDQIRTYASGRIAIDFNKKMCDKTTAAGADEDYAMVPANAVGRDMILSTATAALLADKTVTVWVTDPATAGESCTVESLNIQK
jgi:hypothetical protein